MRPITKTEQWICCAAMAAAAVVLAPSPTFGAETFEAQVVPGDLLPGPGGGGSAPSGDLPTVTVPDVVSSSGILQGVEPVIVQAYRKQEQLAAAGGLLPELYSFSPSDYSTPTFALSGFQTLYPESFDEVLITEVISPPGWKVLQSTLGTRQFVFEDGSVQQRAFSFTRLRDVPKEAPEAWDAMTVSEALAVEGERDGGLKAGTVVAITRFRVLARAGDETLSYSAAVAWMTGAREKRSQGSLEAIFFDLHNPGLHGAALLQDPPLTQEDLDRGQEDPGIVPTNCCLVENDPIYLPSQTYTGTGDHISGDHRMTADFRVDCICERHCYQTAVMSVVNEDCVDHGSTYWFFHAMAEHLQTRGGGRPDAFDRGTTAQASGGYICGMRECLTPFCSVTVSVNIGTFGSVSFSGGNSDWNRTVGWENVTCGPCTKTGGGGGVPD